MHNRDLHSFPTRRSSDLIVERSKGGTHDEDNLIVTCQTCHTDVHSSVPFMRRFTPAELKGHRDALIKLVSAGTLPSNDTEDRKSTRLNSSHANISYAVFC